MSAAKSTIVWRVSEPNSFIPLFNTASGGRPMDAFRGLITLNGACSAIEAYTNSVIQYASNSVPFKSKSFWCELKRKMHDEDISVNCKIRDKVKFILRKTFADESWNDGSYRDFHRIVEFRNSLTHWIPTERNFHQRSDGTCLEEVDDLVLYLLDREIIAPTNRRPIFLSDVVEVESVRAWIRQVGLSTLRKLSDNIPADSNELRNARNGIINFESEASIPSSISVHITVDPRDVTVVPSSGRKSDGPRRTTSKRTKKRGS